MRKYKESPSLYILTRTGVSIQYKSRGATLCLRKSPHTHETPSRSRRLTRVLRHGILEYAFRILSPCTQRSIYQRAHHGAFSPDPALCKAPPVVLSPSHRFCVALYHYYVSLSSIISRITVASDFSPADEILSHKPNEHPVHPTPICRYWQKNQLLTDNPWIF